MGRFAAGLKRITLAMDAGFEESSVKRDNDGKFAATAMAASIKAPSHASIYAGGAHGGGTVGYSTTKQTPNEIHANLTKQGFKRESAKGHTERTKMGRTTAYSSAKVREHAYSHPEGHTAEVKHTTDGISGQTRSYVQVHIKP